MGAISTPPERAYGAGMSDRLVTPLLVLLVLAVLGTGLVTWRADLHAREASRHQACLEEAQATALTVLVATNDQDRRLRAAQQLSEMVGQC